MKKSTFAIAKGRCNVYLAFDVGLAVRLEEAATLLHEKVERPQVGKHRQTKWFGYDPPPVRFASQEPEIQIGDWKTGSTVELTVWDFGSVTVAYQIPLPEGTKLEELVRLSETLYLGDALEKAAQQLVERIVARLGPSIKKPRVHETTEDYVVFEIEPPVSTEPKAEDADDGEENEIKIADFVKENRRALARILRADNVDLAEEVVEDALRYRCSYTTRDALFVDWSTAFIVGKENDDVCAVLELVQAQLLGLRLLDEQLDNDLDDAYPFSDETGFQYSRNTLVHLGRLKIDLALLYEGIQNASNLIGEQYLATVYKRASERMGFAELDSSITRKLGVIDAIEEQVNTRRGTRHSHILEIIIILLFLYEVLARAFFP